MIPFVPAFPCCLPKHRPSLVHPLRLAAASAALLLGVMVSPARATQPPAKGMVLWLKADALGDAVDAEGRVKLWRNLAASHPNPAVQPEPGRQPLLRKTAGGKMSVAFDGNDDFLHLPELALGKTVSVFLVLAAEAQTEGGSAWRGILCGDADAFRPDSNQYAFALPQAEQPRQFVVQAPPAKDVLRLNGDTQLPQRSHFTIVGFGVRPGKSPEISLREHGRQTRKAVASGLTGELAKGYTLGQGGSVAAGKPGRFFRGEIAEILIYDRALPEAEILQVESELCGKYSIPLPPHPPVAGLDVWIRPELQPVADGPEVVRLSPVKIGNLSHEGLKAARLVQPAIDERPTLLPGLAGSRIRFDSGNSLTVEGWKPGADDTLLAAVTGPEGAFRIVSEWPAVRSGGKLEGICGELHEWLGYSRKLSAVELQQATRYLTDRHEPSCDRRRFRNGQMVFHNGYVDQPYVVECRDGSWLCVMTTSTLAEGGQDQTLVTCRSRDQGATWTQPVANVEPPLLQQPSWGTLLVAPSGRVFLFYNVKDGRADVPGRLVFCCRFSDDHGATWSPRRYPLPLPRLPQDKPNQTPNGWSVCPPVARDDVAILSFSRFVPPGRSLGRGVIYRSPNLLTEPDLTQVRWEVLPEDSGALRSESIASNMQEEHILVPLREPGHFYCIWRTEVGHPLESYSRDGGKTWTPPEVPRVGGDGPAICQPVACTMPVALGNGKFLLWHHFSPGSERGSLYRPRSKVWLSAGEERSGKIVWSYPELLLYDDHLPVNGLGMSYPGFLVQEDGITVLTTDKMSARQFRIDPGLLDGLWNQLAGKPVPLPPSGAGDAGQPVRPIAHALTWQIQMEFAAAGDDQILAELRQQGQKGIPIARVSVPAGSQTLRLSLWDHLGRCAQMDLPSGLLQPDKRHDVTFILDGDAQVIIPIIDSRIPVDGESRFRGWFVVPPGFVWNTHSPLTAEPGPATTSTKVRACRIWDRALTVSQVISMQRDSRRGD